MNYLNFPNLLNFHIFSSLLSFHNGPSFFFSFLGLSFLSLIDVWFFGENPQIFHTKVVAYYWVLLSNNNIVYIIIVSNDAMTSIIGHNHTSWYGDFHNTDICGLNFIAKLSQLFTAKRYLCTTLTEYKWKSTSFIQSLKNFLLRRQWPQCFNGKRPQTN